MASEYRWRVSGRDECVDDALFGHLCTACLYLDCGRDDRSRPGDGQGNLGQTPRFRGNLSTTYSNDLFSLTAQLLYISKGKNDKSFNAAQALSINDNEIEAAAYLNLYGSIKVTDRMKLTATIDNALNRDPRVAPYATPGSGRERPTL